MIFVLFWSPGTPAEDEEEEGPWSGNAALGYLATSGNTDNSNLNSSLEVGYKTGDWQFFEDGYRNLARMVDPHQAGGM